MISEEDVRSKICPFMSYKTVNDKEEPIPIYCQGSKCMAWSF